MQAPHSLFPVLPGTIPVFRSALSHSVSLRSLLAKERGPQTSLLFFSVESQPRGRYSFFRSSWILAMLGTSTDMPRRVVS